MTPSISCQPPPASQSRVIPVMVTSGFPQSSCFSSYIIIEITDYLTQQ